MSILIKGMEMPDHCGNCQLFLYACCLLHDGIPAHQPNVHKRPDWCPLIEVPKHGRLIDADALIINIMDRGIEGLQTDDLHEIQQTIDDASTVIPADKEC